MKFAFCGYDFFSSCLRSLLQEGHTLLKLFSFPICHRYDFDDTVIKTAMNCKVPIQQSRFTAEDMKWLAENGCEAIISAAYVYKIPEHATYVPFAVNVHPTLLPHGKGSWPLPWTILKDLPESGVTLHKISQKWDKLI